MEVAFVCCTPYHIIMSFQLAKTKYKDFHKDIFICDHFENAYELYTNIKEQCMWRSVHFIKDHDINYDKSFLKHKKANMFFKNGLSYFLGTEFKPKYNELCVFTHNIFSKILYSNVVKYNPKLNFNFVEEGTSTYTLTYRDTFKNRIINNSMKVLNKKIFSNKDISNILLFKPELYSGNLDKNIMKLSEIDKNDNWIKQKTNEVFKYDLFEIPYKNHKFIYFDQTISKDGEIPIDEKQILIQMLTNMKDESLIVKLHPRDSKEKYKGEFTKVHSDGNLPWELIYLNEDLEENVLITIRSSSVFTPKIMFNKENTIILLYKIAGIKDEVYKSFVDKVKKIYIEDKVYIPETWDEFRQVLRDIDKD